MHSAPPLDLQPREGFASLTPGQLGPHSPHSPGGSHTTVLFTSRNFPVLYVGGNNTGLKIIFAESKKPSLEKGMFRAATEKNYCSPLVVPRTIVGLLFFLYLCVFLLVNVLCKSCNSVWFYLTWQSNRWGDI
jgi:hypothetical protein